MNATMIFDELGEFFFEILYALYKTKCCSFKLFV